jgi:predicted RNA binding protein YcfA (HicA-like mRNA interferase family)
MSRVKKAVAKILEGRSDANFDFADLCFVLERAGFTARTGKGSHTIFYRDGVEEIVNVQPRKGGQAKPYQVRQVREIILKYQLEID